MADYLLPDPGEGLTEAEIVTWRVAVGDTIEINDVVVEIETAKSLVELPSPYAGTVTALLVAEGDTVEVGTPIITIGDAVTADGASDATDGAVVSDAGGEVAPDAAVGTVGSAGIDTNTPPEGQPTLVGYGPREGSARRRPRKGGASPRSAAGAADQVQLQAAFTPGGAESDDVVEGEEEAVPARDARADEDDPPTPAADRALAKPPVRKLARDLGVDLSSVPPTGPRGTVSREDVERAGAARPASPSGPASPAPDQDGAGEDEWREPVTGVGRTMARAMVSSAFSAPHVTEWVTVDVTATTQLLERLRTRRELREVTLGPLAVLARAVTLALRRTPLLNSVFDEDRQEVVHRRRVNLGIAAATPRGLVVPNVKDAGSLGLLGLAAALSELTATAREGRTTPAAMSDGTFTITNVGVFGIDAGTPIINPGESAILCLGAVRRQPWVVRTDGVEQVVPRDVTTLALSFDHRHIDGRTGSQFLADVASLLEDPASALLF